MRSTPVCQSTVRQQFNDITAFVDASNVYGNDKEHAAVLRTYRVMLESTIIDTQLAHPVKIDMFSFKYNTKKL